MTLFIKHVMLYNVTNLTSQNEIQSAHWTHKQCTLFTAHAWIDGQRHQSMIVWSDYLEHGKLAVFMFVDAILKHLTQKYSGIEKVMLYPYNYL